MIYSDDFSKLTSYNALYIEQLKSVAFKWSFIINVLWWNALSKKKKKTDKRNTKQVIHSASEYLINKLGISSYNILDIYIFPIRPKET